MTKTEGRPPQPLRLESVLHALGDPVRLGIVRRLARNGESSCAALDGGRSKSTMSHHFKVLREAGLVQTRSQGTAHMNALSRAAIDAAFPGLLAAVLEAPGDADNDAATLPFEGPVPPRARGRRIRGGC